MLLKDRVQGMNWLLLGYGIVYLGCAQARLHLPTLLLQGGDLLVLGEQCVCVLRQVTGSLTGERPLVQLHRSWGIHLDRREGLEVKGQHKEGLFITNTPVLTGRVLMLYSGLIPLDLFSKYYIVKV